MGENLNFDFSFKLNGVTVAVQNIEQLNGLLKETKTALKSADFGTESFKQLTEQVAKLKNIQSDVNNEIKNTQKELVQSGQAAGSYNQLNIELNKLRTSYKSLSEESRNTVGKTMLQDIQKLDAELKKMDASMGQHTRNVGNYPQTQGVSGVFASVDMGGFNVGAFTSAASSIQLLTAAFTTATLAAIKYEDAFYDLKALIDATPEEFDKLISTAKEVQTIQLSTGQTIISSSTEVLTAIKLIGNASPEFLKTSDGMKEMAESAIILSKASGEDLKTSVSGLVTIMQAFDYQATDSKTAMNVLAAAAKAGAAEIPALMSAIKTIGPIAKQAGLSLQDTAAAIEVLSMKGIQGEQAGTMIRNILTNMQAISVAGPKAKAELIAMGVDLDKISDSSLSFSTRLEELKKIQGGVTAEVKAFNKENEAAGAILIENSDKLAAFTMGMSVTNEAEKQAGIRLLSLGEQFKAFGQNLLNTFTTLGNIISPVLSLLLALTNLILEHKAAIAILAGTYLALTTSVEKYTSMWESLTGVFTKMGDTILPAITKGFQTAKTNFLELSAALNINPWILLATAIAAVATAIYMLDFSGVKEAEKEMKKFTDETTASVFKQVAAEKALFDVATDTKRSLQDRTEAVKTLVKLYPDLLKYGDLEKKNIGELIDVYRAYTKELVDNLVSKSVLKEQEAIADKALQKQTALNKLIESEKNASWMTRGAYKTAIEQTRQELDELTNEMSSDKIKKAGEDLRRSLYRTLNIPFEEGVIKEKARRTVAAIEKDIKAANDRLQATTKDTEAKPIQEEIRALEREKEAILGTKKAKENSVKDNKKLLQEKLRDLQNSEKLELDAVKEGSLSALEIRLKYAEMYSNFYDKNAKEMEMLESDVAVKKLEIKKNVDNEEIKILNNKVAEIKDKRDTDLKDEHITIEQKIDIQQNYYNQINILMTNQLKNGKKVYEELGYTEEGFNKMKAENIKAINVARKEAATDELKTIQLFYQDAEKHTKAYTFESVSMKRQEYEETIKFYEKQTITGLKYYSLLGMSEEQYIEFKKKKLGEVSEYELKTNEETIKRIMQMREVSLKTEEEQLKRRKIFLKDYQDDNVNIAVEDSNLKLQQLDIEKENAIQAARIKGESIEQIENLYREKRLTLEKQNQKDILDAEQRTTLAKLELSKSYVDQTSQIFTGVSDLINNLSDNNSKNARDNARRKFFIDKYTGMLNAGINTAEAITKSLAMDPTGLSSILPATLGAIQIAVIASKQWQEPTSSSSTPSSSTPSRPSQMIAPNLSSINKIGNDSFNANLYKNLNYTKVYVTAGDIRDGVATSVRQTNPSRIH